MTEWKEEYRETGENFREGFKLIFEISKGNITTNTVLFTSYVLLRNFHNPPDSITVSNTILIICVIGMLANAGFEAARYRMSKYLRIIVERAVEIENKHNFQLYTEVDKNSKKNDRLLFNNVRIPSVGSFAISIIWLFLALSTFKIDINL